MVYTPTIHFVKYVPYKKVIVLHNISKYFLKNQNIVLTSTYLSDLCMLPMVTLISTNKSLLFH